MMDFEARLNKVEGELASLRERITFLRDIHDNFDKMLDKLDARQQEDRKELQNSIDDLRVDLLQEIKALREDMAKQHATERQKIDDLNKWKWIIFGGAMVVGWLFSRAFDLIK